MAKFNIGDKVWIIPEERVGIVVDLRGSKLVVESTVELEPDVDAYMDEHGAVVEILYTIWGRISMPYMSYELLHYTKGMELLYE